MFTEKAVIFYIPWQKSYSSTKRTVFQQWMFTECNIKLYFSFKWNLLGQNIWLRQILPASVAITTKTPSTMSTKQFQNYLPHCRISPASENERAKRPKPPERCTFSTLGLYYVHLYSWVVSSAAPPKHTHWPSQGRDPCKEWSLSFAHTMHLRALLFRCARVISVK